MSNDHTPTEHKTTHGRPRRRANDSGARSQLIVSNKKNCLLWNQCSSACDLAENEHNNDKNIKNRSQLNRQDRFLSTHHGNSLITDFHLTLFVSTQSQKMYTASWTMTTATRWWIWIWRKEERNIKKISNTQHNDTHNIVKQQHLHSGTHTFVTWLGLFNTHSCVLAVFYFLLNLRSSHFCSHFPCLCSPVWHGIEIDSKNVKLLFGYSFIK